MGRNRTCFAPKCTSGYKSNNEKVSMFKAPSDVEKRKIWQKIIPRADRILTSQDVLCEKHFREGDIVKYIEIGGVSIRAR